MGLVDKSRDYFFQLSWITIHALCNLQIKTIVFLLSSLTVKQCKCAIRYLFVCVLVFESFQRKDSHGLMFSVLYCLSELYPRFSYLLFSFKKNKKQAKTPLFFLFWWLIRPSHLDYRHIFAQSSNYFSPNNYIFPQKWLYDSPKMSVWFHNFLIK